MAEKLFTSQIWSIPQFYKKALRLAWNNKKLWVLGVGVVLYASSGSANFNLNNSTKKEAPTTQTQSAPSAPSDTSSPSFAVRNIGKSLLLGLKTAPPVVYIVLGTEITALIISSIIFRMIAQGWASAALIVGVDDAANNRTIDLARIAKEAVGRIKAMVWISLVPTLLVITVALIAGIALFIAAHFSPAFVIFAGIIFLIALAFALCRISVATMLAYRYCSIEKMPGGDSLKAGLAASKRNVMKGLRLGLANALSLWAFVACAFVPLAVVGYFVFKPLLSHNQPHVSGYLILLPFTVIFLLSAAFVPAIYQVFSYATWHFAFLYMNKLKKERT